MEMQVFLGEFSWFFIIVFSSHLITSVHGEIYPPPPYLLGDDVAINCGSVRNYTALDGRYWIGETPFLRPNGKSTTSTSTHKFLSPDPTPYLMARISFSYFYYNFQVNPGQKFVRLHFYPESYLGFENSQDFFTVKANSFTLVQSFSASLAAHALGVKYFVKEYCLNVNETGNLQITFFALQTNSKTSDTYVFVNGIEIISMPTGLYYTPDDNLGVPIVGQSNRFHYVDNSTALELVQRLNVGGGSISPVEDTGNLFRMWIQDVDYFQESGFQQINHLVPAIEYTNIQHPSVAPSKIYHTSRKLRENLKLEEHFTWKIHVDIGFAYLIRLHFCNFGVEFTEDGSTEDFSILIQNLVAETQVNAIQLTGGNGIPVYKDYLFITEGEKADGKHDLFVTLHSCNELVLGLLKGLEIFKLSNPDNSLATPNPSCPKRTSSFWTLKIRKILVAFGQSNVIMTALTIILSIVTSVVYHLRRIGDCIILQERNVESAPEEEDPSCHRFSLSEILLATQNFNEALVIGKGGFGKVYKGFIHGRPQNLAIKRLKSDSKQGEHEFWIEIKTLSKLWHVHLVSLIGFCMERQEMIIVYEYMPRGTIADNLYKLGRNGMGIFLTWEQRLRICIGAARGLDYLHTGTQHGVIHRDVKDTNILLDENFVAKISDFGLSKIGERQGELSTKIKGTPGYLDPDYVMTHKPSTKSDVYAFGIVLLVVLAGRPAVERILGEMQNLLACYHECVSKGEMNEIIDPCLQGDILTESLTSFMETVGNCLHRHPKKRSTMGQVVVQLEHALEKQIGAVPSTLDADSTAFGQSSPAGLNQSFESYELQVAPIPEEIITSLSGGGNASKEIQNAVLETKVEVLQSKGKDHHITQKPLWGRPWFALRNIRKSTHTKKKDLTIGTARVFSLKDIKLATRNFSHEFMIGAGASGEVYKGFINGCSGLTAIKRYSTSRAEGFQAEVELLSTTHYIHIVPFLGFCCEGNELIVVYDYMIHGTLDNHLYRNNVSGKDNNNISLTWEQRLRICIDAARGLNYLHEVGVIHRDVNDHNILLDENFVAKISEFGLCKKLILGESESHLSTLVLRNPAYLDPSYYFYWRLTKASDVYSFGIVLLVVLSGRQAIDNSNPEKHCLYSSWFKTCYRKGNFDELIDPKLVGEIPSRSLDKFVHLINNCLHGDPKLRPVMDQVVANLEESLDMAG